MQPDMVDRLLDFAIANEERAAAFYRHCAALAHREPMKELLLGFAEEEDQHKAKLQTIKASQQELLCEEKVAVLGLAEQLDDEPLDLSGDMDFREALVIAMKAEKAAYKLYSRLAESAEDPFCKTTLLGLAQEEAKHKLRFEIEYDDWKPWMGW
jgi:rubrerythrin